MNVATILAARINSVSSPENTAWISGAQTDNRPELREPLHANHQRACAWREYTQQRQSSRQRFYSISFTFYSSVKVQSV